MPQEIDKFVAPRYRSAGRRPEAQQDRRASADAPLALLRGMLSGVAGAPGDLESLVRMLPGLSEKTVLPTSEEVERALPLRAVSDTPVGRAATGIGQIGGGFYTGPGSPLRAVAALPSAVRKAGRDFAVASGQPTANVIKQKGGNWLAGSVEDALGSLKRSGRAGNPLTFDAVQADPGADALNNWIDKQLTRYVKNEMATPEDPVRALAERGVLHRGINPNYPTRPSLGNRVNREHAGFSPEGSAESDLAKYWENVSDNSVRPSKAREFLDDYVDPDAEVSPWLAKNPWLEKVPPETPVHEIYSTGGNLNSDAGFTHLMDELRNATNPNSGLPRELLLKYDALDKVSVPQAVERVSKINDWRAAQKAEADMARANNAASVLHKDYPDKGFRWVELKKPEDTGKMLSSVRNDPRFEIPQAQQDRFRDQAGREALQRGIDEESDDFMHFVESRVSELSDAWDAKNPNVRDMSVKQLEDALKYEGETMGHCVGGYCPDVIEGRSRIFSLRSAKGEPHVTIEVQPQRSYGTDHINQFSEQAYNDLIKEGLNPGTPDDMSSAFLSAMNKRTAELAEANLPQRIVQIKGKANRAPNPEYLPFVQDFVKSGQWSDVGDLDNTGLIRIDPTGDLAASFRKVGKAPPAHTTQDELTDLLRWHRNEGELPPGYATGGIVQGAYDPSRIDALAAELAKELAL